MHDRTDEGFRPVIANPDFRALWIAQWLAQTAQHAIHFMQMVLIEQLTGSAVHLGLVILAFTIPGVIFSPIAGVVVDRFPKKWILFTANLLRVFLAAGYLVVLATLHGTWELLAIYAITFATATLAQFFSPAEAASIPLLVGESRLLAANSLFNLTMALSQVVGLLVLGPLVIGLLQVNGGFVLVACMYLAAAIAVSRLPLDRVPSDRPTVPGTAGWRLMLSEVKEGWEFVSRHAKVKVATTQLVAITTLVMVMAELAPGYAARVLGMAPENAVIVFAPAGIGMLLATGIVGRWGHILRRLGFAYTGLALAGLAFALLGILGLDYNRWLAPILRIEPRAALSLTSATMGLAFLLGFCLSSANILSQTTVQQEAPAYIRGRVFSVQYMMNNLVGIPPMLAVGGIADVAGIPRVLILVGAATALVAAVTWALARRGGSQVPPTDVSPGQSTLPAPTEVSRETR